MQTSSVKSCLSGQNGSELMAEKKLLRRIKITPPLLSVLLGVVVLALVLFVPPVYGISDNGQFGQILAGNGLYKLDRGQEDEYFLSLIHI